MPSYSGSCFCRAITYEITIDSPEDVLTALCHCNNCKKAYGSNYAQTTKVPRDSFRILTGTPKVHAADNGSGTVMHREFCDTCGSPILEYPERPPKDTFRYVLTGTLDNPAPFTPKEEIFCHRRAVWMPELRDAVQSQE